MTIELIPGYELRTGSARDRATLVKFMQRTYQELYPEQDFSHLAKTVDQYYSSETPLWWVDLKAIDGSSKDELDSLNQELVHPPSSILHPSNPVGCLWMGNAVDQVKGDRHAHIFLLYVASEHRRQGIGAALVRYAENWARKRGDRQMGLQVFTSNQPALNLYQKLGYQTHSFWMLKPLN